MNERRTKLETIFHAAMDLASSEERESYLSEACTGDPELRREVDELLKSAAAADPVFQAGREACHVPEALPAVVLTEKPSDKIGRYKLLEQIGEGGMGVVYMAQQEEPVRRRVALKIIKLGMDTRQVVARFEAERQALALMDHPHIAKVLDAGATDSGRPYFVMELVQGVPITRFCDENGLSPDARIKLFIPVCQAIQSAHQKGIIHRDLKPSNVLVTMHNGVPHPMVIDFGVAKATGQKLTEKTLFTNFATMIGTPAYMSPEQAEMSKLDVDTRSDIYSLGVLLYELLTGSTPFPEERLRSVAYREMQRIIVEEEPERPSTRLKRKRVTSPSPVLRTPSPPLGERDGARGLSEINSDLDWIVMKCLEKDRDRRYETANGLAADIQRHLNTEPIIARPPSASYRFQKFVRRNKLQFGAAAFGLTVLLLAVVVSTWQAVRARRAELSAQEQAQNARFIKDFLVQQVLAGNPYVQPQTDPGRRALVDRIAGEVEKEFSAHPEIKAELHMALAAAYAGLGDGRLYASHAEKALEIRQPLLGPQHSETLWALAQTAQAYVVTGRIRDAEHLITNALAAIRSSPHTWSSGEAEVLYTHAMVIGRGKSAAEALPYFEEAMSVARRTQDQMDYKFKNKMWEFAYITKEAGRWEEAGQLWSQAIAQIERDHGAEHPLTAAFLKGQADLFMARGRWPEARTNLERAIPIYHRALGTNHSNGLDAETLLADVFANTGRIEDATRLYQSLPPRWAKLFPYFSARNHCESIADFFVRHQHSEDAKQVYEALRASWETNPPENLPQFESFLTATAASKGWSAAAELCQKQFDSFPDSLWIWLNKAWIFRYVGDAERYQRVVEKMLSLPATLVSTNDQHVPIEIAALGPFPFSPEQTAQLDAMMTALEAALPGRATNQQAWGYRAIGHLQLQLGRPDKCLEALEKSACRQETPDPFNLFLKAICLHRLDRDDEARAVFDQAETILKPQLGQPLNQVEGFLPAWQIYQQLLMRREAQATLGVR